MIETTLLFQPYFNHGLKPASYIHGQNFRTRKIITIKRGTSLTAPKGFYGTGIQQIVEPPPDHRNRWGIGVLPLPDLVYLLLLLAKVHRCWLCAYATCSL